MGIKDTLNEKPAVAVGATAALILIAALVAYFTLSNGSTPGMSSKAFFTVDDGKTYFADDATKSAPFDHGGKQAVRAYVFDCGGTKFVSYLERYTPEGKRVNDEQQAALRSGKPSSHAMPPNGVVFREVKKPGEKDWVDSLNHGKSGPIMAVRCPGGGTGDPVPVDP